MTAQVNITKKRGDTRRHTFTIKDSGSAIVDLSQWSDFILSITSTEEPLDDTTLIKAIIGQITTDGADGLVHFVPDGAVSIGEYFYDIQALDSNSEKITFVQGNYVIEQDRGKT